jgi:hypothetical protein
MAGPEKIGQVHWAAGKDAVPVAVLTSILPPVGDARRSGAKRKVSDAKLEVVLKALRQHLRAGQQRCPDQSRKNQTIP